MMPKRAGNICKLREAETDGRTEERTDGQGRGKREEGREST